MQIEILLSRIAKPEPRPTPVPVGYMMYVSDGKRFFHSIFAGLTWMECDGASVSRKSYSQLFDAIGTTYGSKDPHSFNIPDLRGVSSYGWPKGPGV